jgi:hypothetical protein
MVENLTENSNDQKHSKSFLENLESNPLASKRMTEYKPSPNSNRSNL